MSNVFIILRQLNLEMYKCLDNYGFSKVDILNAFQFI